MGNSMIKYFYSILFITILTSNYIKTADRPFRVTQCSPDLTYNRGAVWNLQAAQDHVPPMFGVHTQQPSVQIINNNNGSSNSDKLKKATGIMAIIGGAVAVGKYIYSYVEFGQQVVDVSQQAIDLQKQQQKLQERALQESALRTQAQNEVNDLNRQFSMEAHEAHAAINSLSLQQLHLMAIAEEEEGSPSRYFRDRYAAALVAKK
ncbi:MAG TPA: hypothetical protein VFM31_01160 [Nitrososphaeraceae archaeon]|nr:hypothetical protein [Nitrososphaeraceae archaeon]